MASIDSIATYSPPLSFTRFLSRSTILSMPLGSQIAMSPGSTDEGGCVKEGVGQREQNDVRKCVTQAKIIQPLLRLALYHDFSTSNLALRDGVHEHKHIEDRLLPVWNHPSSSNDSLVLPASM